MPPPHDPSRPFWHWWRRPDVVAAEIDEELRLHLDMRAEELKARGLPAEAAHREALRQFGDLESTRSYCRRQDLGKETRMRRGLALGEVVHDVRSSFRGLLRAPLMTALILATVGLGIGATTAIFAAVDTAILRPLPYANPDRLVRIYTDAPPNRFRFSVADYLALEAQQTHFEQVSAFTDRAMAFTSRETAERVRGKEVSYTYFALLGIRPAIGRDFSGRDGAVGGPPAVIVSHAYWQQRLGARTAVIGQPIRLDGRDHVLVGVLPPAAGPLDQGREFFVAAQFATPPRRGPFPYVVLGRLRPGADRPAAAEELRAINQRIFPLWRASYQDQKATWSLMDLDADIVGDRRPMAGLALVAVALVWLIACANASNLLVARVTSRRRELAIRTALGASRGRVVRHLLAESGLLAAGAAVLGGALAWAGVSLVRAFGSPYVPRADEIGADGRLLALFAVLTAASALLFGLVPALHGSGGAMDEALRSGGRSSTSSRSVRRLRRMLVGGQFAIATPLVIVAALLLGSLNELGRVDLGFDTRNLLTGAISLPAARYPEAGRVTGFWDELRRRVTALPGVSATAYADGRPPDDVGNFNNFDLEDAPTPPGQSQPVAPWVSVTPQYFQLLGLGLSEGRLLVDEDGRRPALEAVVVDRAWAGRFFPRGRAVGKRFREGGCTECPWTTVVGVVSDVKYDGLNRPGEGAVYWPMDPASRDRYLLVRSTLEPEAVVPAVRQVVRELDPGLPFSSVATVDDLVARSLRTPRMLTLLVGGFASVALLLSIVGIYGVMAYYVEQHAKDISIRLALGGSPKEVVGLIVTQGMRVVAGGVGAGLVAALALTRLVSDLLFGIRAVDPLTYAAATAGLLGLAAVACLVPASRATAGDTAIVLRAE